MKRRRTLVLAASAAVLVALAAAAVISSVEPKADAVSAHQRAVAVAAAADDWAALTVDDEGTPLLDSKGNPKLDGRGNPLAEPTGSPLIKPGEATEKRSAAQSLPTVKVIEGVEILDTTTTTAGLLNLLLVPENPHLVMSNDRCLLDWAKAELPKVAGTSFSGVMTVCGRDAAVMYGGYSTSVIDLNLHADHAPDKVERAGLSAILYKTDRLGYASVATEDGRGILLIAARATADAASAGNPATDPTTEPAP